MSSKKQNKAIGRIVEAILPKIVRFISVEPTNSRIKEVRLMVNEEDRYKIGPEDLALIKKEIWQKIGFLPLLLVEEYEPEFCRV